MVPSKQFIIAADEPAARVVFDQNSDIDTVLIPTRREATHLACRSEPGLQPIEAGIIISDSTPIVDLPILLSITTQLLLVIAGRQIVGLVTVSDLNSPLCKIPYFALFECLERALSLRLPPQCDRVILAETFSAHTVGQIERRIKFMRDENVLPTEFAAMDFRQLLTYSTRVKLAVLNSTDLSDIVDVRNRTAHGVRHLVSDIANDLKRLVKTQKLATELIRQLGRRANR
jgi:hypothetical protein